MGAWVMYETVSKAFRAFGTDANRPATIPLDCTLVDIARLPVGNEAWNGTAFVDNTAVQPNGRGFWLGCKGALADDDAKINGLLKKYPLFPYSIAEANWPRVQRLIISAKAAVDITQAEYDAIKAVAAANNIPITLP